MRTLGSRERTALAWQRTALSLMAGSAILVRLTWERLGVLAVGFLVGALILGGWVFIESRARYADAIGLHPRSSPRGARAPTFLGVAVLLIALTELFALLR